MSDFIPNVDIRKILFTALDKGDVICFSNIGLRDVPVVKLLENLEMVVAEQKLETLKIVFFNMLPKGDADLVKIAETLKECPNIMEVTTSIDFSLATNLTTLKHLSKAGIFNNLKSFSAWGCSFLGDDVLTSDLCANLPALRELKISTNNNPNIIILTPDILCALPSECKIFIYGEDIQVVCFSSENDKVVLKTLPPTHTVWWWETNNYIRVPQTVAEICADTGIHDSITKSALKRC